MKKIAFLTSGGDAPGMNATIRAVTRACVYNNLIPVGVSKGFDGLINGDFLEMNARSVKGIINKGGTILKTARSKGFRSIEGRKKAYQSLKENNIDALVVIGGNGSFTGANIFSSEFDVPIIGVPGTIDNDLFGTDKTIGYDTANNTVLQCVDKIRDTASSHNRLFLVEVMGRDAGFIALNTGLASGALDIILPEENKSIDDLFAEIEKGASNKKTSNIIIVSEGNKLGGSFDIAKKLKEKFNQLDIKVTILGHLQRGGSPSCSDRVLSSELGVAAVEGLLNGRSGVMAGKINNQITYTFFEQAIFNKAHIDQELLRISKILSI